MQIHATVSRGKNLGKSLFPHRHRDGAYVVSKTRFKKDYVRLQKIDDVINYIENGYSLRMSNKREGIPPRPNF